VAKLRASQKTASMSDRILSSAIISDHGHKVAARADARGFIAVHRQERGKKSSS
jgi:hypothetical protein